MRIKVGLFIICIVLMASISSRGQTDADEVGWDPQTCWDCDESESPVAAIALATILGIPIGLSGILRRRYSYRLWFKHSRAQPPRKQLREAGAHIVYSDSKCRKLKDGDRDPI